MTQRPNSRELWIAVRTALEEASIEVQGTKFSLEREREEWLVGVLNACNQEKYSELLETKENITTKINSIVEEAPFTAIDLLALKLSELKDICRARGWRGWTKLRKAALVEFILNQ